MLGMSMVVERVDVDRVKARLAGLKRRKQGDVFEPSETKQPVTDDKATKDAKTCDVSSTMQQIQDKLDKEEIEEKM